MQSINKKALIISIVLALFTAFMIYNYLKSTSATPQKVEYVNTYVAAKTLQPNHMIVDSDLKQVKIEKDYLNINAVSNVANIVGKRLKDRIIEGEQILSDRLVQDNNSKMAYVIPAGMRAVSININEQSAVSYTLMPGDFVDVVASFDSEDEKNGSTSVHYPRITRTVIQDVEVLAVGGNIDMTDTKSDAPKTVTLAVNPQNAEKLIYVTDYGTTRLILRQSGDDKNVNTNGITRGDISPSTGISASSPTTTK